MKPPYTPSQSKLPQPSKDGVPISKELQSLNFAAYKKEKAKDPLWDKDY